MIKEKIQQRRPGFAQPDPENNPESPFSQYDVNTPPGGTSIPSWLRQTGTSEDTFELGIDAQAVDITEKHPSLRGKLIDIVDSRRFRVASAGVIVVGTSVGGIFFLNYLGEKINHLKAENEALSSRTP